MDLILSNQQLEAEKQTLLQCNELTKPYGLALTAQEIELVAAFRFQGLRNTGRIEFGEGIVNKLIVAFRDSPYLHLQEYAQTLCTLQEIFYALKNECNDRWTDDELLERMRRAFDKAGGDSERVADLWEEL